MSEIITVKIHCNSEECEEIREEGYFFETIAEALGLQRDDIEEV